MLYYYVMLCCYVVLHYVTELCYAILCCAVLTNIEPPFYFKSEFCFEDAGSGTIGKRYCFALQDVFYQLMW